MCCPSTSYPYIQLNDGTECEGIIYHESMMKWPSAVPLRDFVSEWALKKQPSCWESITICAFEAVMVDYIDWAVPRAERWSNRSSIHVLEFEWHVAWRCDNQTIAQLIVSSTQYDASSRTASMLVVPGKLSGTRKYVKTVTFTKICHNDVIDVCIHYHVFETYSIYFSQIDICLCSSHAECMPRSRWASCRTHM